MALELAAAARALPARAADRPGPDRLPVLGRMPVELEGVLRQFLPHPRERAPDDRCWSPSAAYPAGIRLSGGSARWHREQRPEAGSWPALPVTARVRRTDPPVAVARPVRDATGTELHTVAVHPGLPFAEHLVGSADGLLLRSEPFPVPDSPLVHAVAITERWVLVLDLPVTHRPAAALVGSATPWRWTPGRPARIGLLARAGGPPPRWFEVGPCFVFHVAAAYEDGDVVVLHAVRHERAFHRSGDASAPRLWRWELDLRTGAVREQCLSDLPVELPVVDGRQLDPARGPVWAVEQDRNERCPAPGPAVVRLDLDGDRARPTARHVLGAGRRAGPPLAAGRPAGGGDGWLLVPVDDRLADRTELLVLDATDLAQVASVVLPFRLPAGVHGEWLPDRGASPVDGSGVSGRPPWRGRRRSRTGPCAPAASAPTGRPGAG